MTFVLQVSHPAGGEAVNPERYWYGFIIHQLVLGSDGKIQPAVVAKEVTQINLTSGEDKRQRGGFFWPVALYNDLRIKRLPSFNQIATSLYVGLADPNLAFSEYKLCLRVDLLIARKGGLKLFDHGMVAKVSAFRDHNEEPWPIEQAHTDDAAVYRTLFKADRPDTPLQPVLDSAWVGVSSFDGGIEKFLMEQETAVKNAVTAKEEVQRKARLASKARSPSVPTTSGLPDSIASPPKAVAQSAPVSIVEAFAPASVTVISESAQPKSITDDRSWVPYAVVAVMIGAVAFLKQQSTESRQTTLSPSSSPVVAVVPVQPKTVPPAPSAASTPALPPSLPSATAPAPESSVDPAPAPVAQANSEQIFVPQGNSVVSKDKLYTLGFEPQLVLVKRMLTATKQQNATEFDSLYEELKRFRPQHEWPKSDAVARRKFNERMETLVNTAKAANDQAGLQSAISLSEQFLMSHFGQSTAHLNLSIARAASGNANSALAPAFHTIVFNPDGANGWVALGVALARSGDESGATNAFCAALRKVNYSDRTVNYFEKVIRGEDLPYPEVTRSMSAIYAVCPKATWARQTSTP